ncbi:uncharacterized protein LOC117092861 isoform X2 [Trachypithecus francoisi]|uniref:uncharacterized protein LOC117092861 isoform X2 n=1 Tax=Trachypithecus francoisi TaxID=54180 RepID=UPI00141B2A59|nr:uncharacterized protein LOC117092861 isoform X2 [Trachypithecus francoisi]
MGPNPRGKAGGSFIWGGARAGSGEALTRKRARGGPVRNRPGGGASSPFLLRPSSRGPAPAAAARRTTPTRGSGSWGHRLKAAAAMSSERDTGGPNAQDKHGLNQDENLLLHKDNLEGAFCSAGTTSGFEYIHAQKEISHNEPN